ncbi:MAG: hypothetical protein R3D98_13250 [Candidatus Krumholzibacteriia bacterium]
MTAFAPDDRHWSPPYCPNPGCHFHGDVDSGPPPGWRYVRHGYHPNRAKNTRIRRYRCRHCRVTFSSQSFSPDYWLKRPDILPQLMTKVVGCMANRQIARDLRVSPPTIDRQVERLGRHCLLFHLQAVRDLAPRKEVAVDGFESFEFSQYHPFHHHLAVDTQTSFFLSFTDSPLRRKGRMTDRQRGRRAELEARYGRPDPQAVRKDMAELLRIVAADALEIIVRSDDHRAYPWAIRTLAGVIVDHQVTSSREHRNVQNPLWEINYLDLLIRQCSSNHKRETIAASKRRAVSAYRLAIFLVWRNYVKLRWERRCRATAAMLVGLFGRALTVEEILVRRLVPSRVAITGRWREYYWKEVTTPALGRNRRHELKLAV